MKNICLLLFALTLMYSCQPDAPVVEETTPTTASATTAPPAANDSTGQSTPANASSFLLGGIWVIEGYVVVGNEQAQQQNVNRWYQFQADGTYQRGRYKEQRGDGRWSYDNAQQLLSLKDKDAAFNSQFDIKISSNNNTMIIIGTDLYDQRRIQGKWVKMTDYPTQETKSIQ
ncbi:MAG: hypothetical protein AAGK47_05815 [Bacteroidota bacterium]